MTQWQLAAVRKEIILKRRVRTTLIIIYYLSDNISSL